MNIINKIIVDIIESEGEVAPELKDSTILIDDLGFDSLKLIDLLVFIESELKIMITEEELASVITVGDLKKIVLGKSNV